MGSAGMPDEAVRPAGTIIAFDFGLRRIGIAVGQTVTGSARALEVVPAADRPDWQSISAIVNAWKPAAMVVGLPLAGDGGETEMSKGARRFGRQLQDRFATPVFFQDERLTSFAAEQRYVNARSGGGMRRKDAALKDAIAAQIILENWFQK
jgi:putative Holliday junction resolvase